MGAFQHRNDQGAQYFTLAELDVGETLVCEWVRGVPGDLWGWRFRETPPWVRVLPGKGGKVSVERTHRPDYQPHGAIAGGEWIARAAAVAEAIEESIAVPEMARRFTADDAPAVVEVQGSLPVSFELYETLPLHQAIDWAMAGIIAWPVDGTILWPSPHLEGAQ